jgi:hypothetical protein
MLPDPPLPVPFLIDLEDRFIRNPHLKPGEADVAGLEVMLTMTPDERWQWHVRWSRFIKDALKRGDDIGLLVYGQSCPYEPT